MDLEKLIFWLDISKHGEDVGRDLSDVEIREACITADIRVVQAVNWVTPSNIIPNEGNEKGHTAGREVASTYRDANVI